MRITREHLMKTTRDTVAQLVSQNHGIVCVYLTGSMTKTEPMLGGTTDIDLVVIHDGEIKAEREIIPLNEEIHFDISHLQVEFFRQPRTLRIDPWIGSYMCLNPLCLHDSQHWFEFTQAGICSQCDRPDYVLQRARSMSELARKKWFEISNPPKNNPDQKIHRYFESLECAANSISLLSGPPLTERRFLLEYPACTKKIGRPGLFAGLLDLFVPELPSVEEWPSLLANWESELSSISTLDSCPISLNTHRLQYYVRCAAALQPDQPEAALWIMLKTWALARNCRLAKQAGSQPWDEVRVRLGLDETGLYKQLNSLDSYLDMVEETLDWWGQEHGIQ